MSQLCSQNVRGNPPAPQRVLIPAEVARWLAAAQDRIARSDTPAALEALAGASIVDIQRHQQTFLAAALQAAYLADLYAAALTPAGLPAWSPPPAGHAAPDRPLRVGYLIGSLVQGQSASGTLSRFARLHDRSRFEMHVIATEEFTQRIPPLRMLQMPWAPSQTAGAGIISELKTAGVPVHTVPPRGSFLDGAAEAIRLARGLRLDVAVLVGSPACPIQAACAFARIAPVQLNFHIGVPLLVRGVDGVIYSNPARQREDAAFIHARGIQALGVLTSGGDVSGAASIAPTPRAALGLPQDAPILVSAANKLPERMLHASFATDLAAFLAAHPTAWWVGIGRGDFTGVTRILQAAGVSNRVVLTGPVPDIRAHVKACDIYLNEYPEGGCNTVIEAMGCGLPVAAIPAGSRHAETIGAELVGPLAIAPGDAAAYWSQVSRWCSDPAERARIGAALRKRALELLDYPVACRAYEAIYERCAAGHASPLTASSRSGV